MVEFPSRYEMDQIWLDAEMERAYWAANWPWIKRLFSGQFVAIRKADQTFVTHGYDLVKTIERAKSTGLELGQFWLKFVTPDGARYS